jgi:hypothetical protein
MIAKLLPATGSQRIEASGYTGGRGRKPAPLYQIGVARLPDGVGRDFRNGHKRQRGGALSTAS